MTPPRSTLLALTAALATTGGVVALSPAASTDRSADCSGWTAYAPLGDESVAAMALNVCDAVGIPPDGWPPGAQFPQSHHPEIQIIR